MTFFDIRNGKFFLSSQTAHPPIPPLNHTHYKVEDVPFCHYKSHVFLKKFDFNSKESTKLFPHFVQNMVR